MKIILACCFIVIVSFLTFFPSFSLSLFGDDWLAFFRYLQHLGPNSSGQWSYVTYFLTPYGAQDILMGLLRNFYQFNSSNYYLTSYVFRLFAAFSIYPLVFYLTKSKLATFFSILFFSVTVIGLDTTNWVFNMPSYITIGFFNLTLYFFLKAREDNHFKQIIFAAILYYLAYIITPIRMHGSLPFIFLLEIFWIIQKKDLKLVRKVITRLAIFLVIFLIIRFTGESQGPSSEISERLLQGFSTSSILLNQGRFDFIFHPFIMFGSMIIPDFLVQQILAFTKINFSTFILNILLLVIFLIMGLLLINTSNLGKKFFIKYFSLSLLWTLIIWIIFPKNLEAFPNNTITPATSLILLNTGIYAFILLILLLIENIRSQRLATAFLISTIWPILSFFAAWWFTPQVIFPTTYRYLIISAIGISVFLASLIALGQKFKHKVFLTIILSLLLITHLMSTNYYLKLMTNFRSQKIADKIWTSIPYISKVGKDPLVFYFEADYNSYFILYNTITFGFPPHMQLLYNLTEKDYAPVPMTKWAEVVSAVSDGQSFKAYGYPLKPIPIDNVYAFYLQGQDNLINITDKARLKLVEDQAR